MKQYFPVALLFCASAFQTAHGQKTKLDRLSFFGDTSVLNVTLTTNMNKVLINHKKNGFNINASLATTLPDGTPVKEPVVLDVRGHYRMENCYIPPIRLKFNNNGESVFYSWKPLKLVSECKISKDNEQYLLKEFIVYKIFNQLTEKSFRVRLLNLTFIDSAGKKKPTTEYAFLLEDIKDLAKRNDCVEWKWGKRNTEETHRKQMTLVAVFEYMIGNTDWAVSVKHNIKLIVPANDTSSRPYAVPYDFDYSGLVNTDYAVPDERLEIENVRQRLYRGYPRSIGELDEVLNIFREKKESIYALINHFDLLTSRSKADITGYLDDFYTSIGRPAEVKSIFVDNARTN
jgi:hypothetical protein